MEQRFEKIILVGKGVGRGTLIAQGDTLRYESKKGSLVMPKVRSVEFAGGRVTVEFGESGTFQTLQFVDMSKSGFRSGSASRELADKLRASLQLVPIAPEEQAGHQQALADRKVAAGKQGRTQMIIGGLLALAGIIVTIITYSNASSSPTGGTYFIAYGPVIFGLILFFQGFAASRSSRS